MVINGDIIAIGRHPKRSLGNTSASFFLPHTIKTVFICGFEKRAMLPMTHQSHTALPTGEVELQRVSASIRGRRNLAYLPAREQLDVPHLVSTKADIDRALESIRLRRRSNAAH
jgi:hypothetical protein